MLKISIIILLGMGVVFGFLLFISFILSLFKYIVAYNSKKYDSDIYINNINEEELVVIMTVINNYCYNNNKNNQIIIRKLGESTQ